MAKQANKKIVKAVNKAITSTVKEAKILEAKGKQAVKSAEKKWKATAPKREALKVGAKKIAKKIEKGSGLAFRKSVQIEKDIVKGVKLGIKNSKKIK